MVIIGDILAPMVALAYGDGSDSSTGFFAKRWVVQLVVMVCLVFSLCLLKRMDRSVPRQRRDTANASGPKRSVQP